MTDTWLNWLASPLTQRSTLLTVPVWVIQITRRMRSSLVCSSIVWGTSTGASSVAYMTLEINTTSGEVPVLAPFVHISRVFPTLCWFSTLGDDPSTWTTQARHQESSNSIDDIDPFVRQEFQIKTKKHLRRVCNSTKKCVLKLKEVLVLYTWQLQLESTLDLPIPDSLYWPEVC